MDAELELELCFEDGRMQARKLAVPCEIGRAPPADLVLKNWRVARRHARIDWRGGACHLEDFGALSGTLLNGRRVARHAALRQGDELIIGPCRLRILTVRAAQSAGHGAAWLTTNQSASLAARGRIKQGHPHMEPTAPITCGAEAPTARSEFFTPGLRDDGAFLPAPVAHGEHEAALAWGAAPGAANAVNSASIQTHAVDPIVLVSAGIAEAAPAAAIRHPHREAASMAATAQDRDPPAAAPSDATWLAWQTHGQRLHAALLHALDLRRRDVSGLSDTALRAEAGALLATLLRDDAHLPAGIDLTRLAGYLLDEAVGLGPLEPLLADPQVTEIMVNRHDEIYVETGGRLLRHAGRFTSEQAVLGVIERIVAPLGRRVDESSPLVDARMRDGSRFNAVIPPVALRGASLTIRKFALARPGMDSLIRLGTLDAAMSRFLQTCVKARRNILVSGGTGSGKTTLLNALSNCIPAGERIVTIEDAAELQLAHAHLVSLESRPANLEGKGRIDIRDLVRNALRMRPDRIVVGECRGAEAFDMLTAMNTGHEGSLSTLHANSARDALARLESMILMAGLDLPLAVVREHIAASVELVVQQARLASGQRLIVTITEITGMESGRIQMQDLFRYRPGDTPAFCGCDVLPQRCVVPGLEPAQAIAWFSQCTPVPDRAGQTVHGVSGEAQPCSG